MTHTPAAPEPDLTGFRQAVDACLDRFLDRKAHTAAADELPPEIIDILRDFLFRGGKRLRPLLCACGWSAGAGGGETTRLVSVAAAMEMFHAFALIHDDVMDRSATRRGRPTVHRALATHHGAHRSQTAAERLGASAAVLVGDLALVWSDELLSTHLSPEQLPAVRPYVDAMRTEVMYGQYLDLLNTGQLTGDIETPLQVIRYKTAKYTIERPLHIGAALAGAGPAVLDACTAFALPLGEAFQLRDDLLGVFGTPEQTGKPVLDDLRDGKHTVLIALALTRANPHQDTILRTLLGSPDLDENGAARIRAILDSTGAHADTEHMIHTRYQQALTALDRAPFPATATAALRQIAHAATTRTA
ncbi:geranylgeranyl diphosphate synthase [Streptomyces pluripotens]|uniref:Geranylgeranyl diphosphate synthase n=1 Tax=Streptomyces pluripotens TaxID=1355015 RepID=A0A221P5W7_9ACTN|nr:polyprenyl synthetase family protein [Streptomyces pluripotens]ARP73401.1 geranylgeranyl diphosphate synthase [Streptomyces pluripotens]ASN27651.1 geranylgeranyl diphosphate synthase [Streptomyces pluripotens]